MKIVALVILIIAIISLYFLLTPPPLSGKEQACINSGGMVRTSLCCLLAEDFPNNCLIGACGCSPDNSHEVKVCECPEGKCFDGNSCVTQVFNFQDCVDAGYPVLESLPRQCRTPDGRTFIEGEET